MPAPATPAQVPGIAQQLAGAAQAVQAARQERKNKALLAGIAAARGERRASNRASAAVARSKIKGVFWERCGTAQDGGCGGWGGAEVDRGEWVGGKATFQSVGHYKVQRNTDTNIDQGRG